MGDIIIITLPNRLISILTVKTIRRIEHPGLVYQIPKASVKLFKGIEHLNRNYYVIFY